MRHSSQDQRSNFFHNILELSSNKGYIDFTHWKSLKKMPNVSQSHICTCIYKTGLSNPFSSGIAMRIKCTGTSKGREMYHDDDSWSGQVDTGTTVRISTWRRTGTVNPPNPSFAIPKLCLYPAILTRADLRLTELLFTSQPASHLKLLQQRYSPSRHRKL